MTFSICVGSYKMPDVVALNVAYLRKVFGDECPILVSDDLSDQSKSIRDWADSNGVAFIGSPRRRGHFCADVLSIINSIVFAESCGVDCGVKVSQRLIPIHPGFGEALEKAMDNPETMICLPGTPLKQQMSRPSSVFFHRMPVLTDVLAIRTGAISGQEMRDRYAAAFEGANHRNDSVVELFMHKVISDRFPGSACVRLAEWSNHNPFGNRLYLRRSQNLTQDYVKAAEAVGYDAKAIDLREWNAIERENYLCRPSCV